MRISDTLKKAAGLFVEIDEPNPEEEFYKAMRSPVAPATDPAVPAAPTPPAPAPKPTPAPRTVEQIVREAPGPNLDEIKVSASQTGPVVSPDGTVDFQAIYKLANLPGCPFDAEQMLELLATLPQELPIETKRATVKVTVNAMSQSTGVNAEAIVADASRKLAALATYAQSFVQQVDQYVSKTELEISALEQEIAKRRQSIEDFKAKQTRVSEACHTESDRLDDVLEFFSLDVAPSKYA
ncbi:hypothetical protein [Fimbriimonas ginsengisoli]|uniref:Uncharacterized protein n=1 Tax=Fimbriimonas ginsengisoli Gsoil 348 TaxID=661478 RepID=A0A068NNF7_FIMGI|nr:hypothetical protein [Fimbriimonas ginsengisoli]AIE84295.1 hypothetical protein OP10G_0927 [Fimbriimonas ginsengisoli Gsoil 348]